MDLEKFLYGTPLTEINNVVDDGPLFLSHMALLTVSFDLLSVDPPL